MWKKEEAEIFFGDETNIQNTANYARGYAPKGKTPVIQEASQKHKIEMMSAISKRGKLHFLLYKDSMNSDKLINSMTRLVADSQKKVFPILDNLQVHHSKAVFRMAGTAQGTNRIVLSASYAPEYNPDELLNSDVKRNADATKSPRTQAELEANVKSRLGFLSSTHMLIVSFFLAPLTRYAS